MLQVLSILQGSNLDDINIDFRHMQNFHDLIVLEINGYQHDHENHFKSKGKENNNGKIILHNDALKPLIALQYINLQSVKLLGSVITSENEIPQLPEDANYDTFSNDIIVTLRTNRNVRDNVRSRKDKNTIPHITFITPDFSEKKILPYAEYKQEQEKAGLSIFAGLEKLSFLRVVNCGLLKIRWEMFQGLDMLQYLSLENNNILFLPEFAFYGTPNLRILSLAKNNLLNLQSTALAGLLELEHLDLSHNKFSHLSELSLPPFPKLLLADFKHNPIEAVFASTFEIMNATKTLYLGGEDCPLDIQPNSFSGLQSLQYLCLFNVRIPIMERELLYGMSNLRELEMTGKINALSYDSFIEVSRLEKLILRKCNIKFISMDAFYGLYSLHYLDLSNNIIDSLPPGVFDQQFSIKELLLQNNNLTELPTGFFKNVPAKMIRLEGNPWHCSCSMRDWQPSVTNKAKKDVEKLCQSQYNKGILCTDSDEYVYERSVAPRCKTPKKFKNWSVYHTLRKQLQCSKNISYKFSRKAYLQKKLDFENNLKVKFYDNRFKYNNHNQTKIYNLDLPINSTRSDQNFERYNHSNLINYPPLNTPQTRFDLNLTNDKNNNLINNNYFQASSPGDIKMINETYIPETVSNAENNISPINSYSSLPKGSKLIENVNETNSLKPIMLPALNQSMNNQSDTIVHKNIMLGVKSITSHIVKSGNGNSKSKHETKSKKDKDKMEVVNRKLVKSLPPTQIKPKNSHVSFHINNTKALTKQAFKSEMERKHKEKIRKYQLSLNNTIHF